MSMLYLRFYWKKKGAYFPPKFKFKFNNDVNIKC